MSCPDCGWSTSHYPGCSLVGTPIDQAASILERAAELVSGDRAIQHGDKAENFGMIARLWSTYLGTEISAAQVATLMVLLKVARTKSGSNNPDDFLDMAGYAGIAGELSTI